MVISLFVLLVCSLAVDGLSSKNPQQKRTCILDSVTATAPFPGSDEAKSNVPFTLLHLTIQYDFEDDIPPIVPD